MNRAARLLATLMLVAGSVSAQQAKPTTPQQVMAMVKADGPHDTVATLDRNGQWESVLRGVATAQPRWLEVALALRPGTDAGGSEELEDALSEALLKAPYRVLPLVKDDWSKESVPVCTFGWDSELPDGVERYVLRLRAALDKTPPPPELTRLRQECLHGIDLTLKDVREHPSSEE